MNQHAEIDGRKSGENEEFTPRQAEILEAALALLVGGGEKAITTAGLARAANCSKESLYKWFGDREGILSAMVAWQASKVRVPAGGAVRGKPAEAFREDFIVFGIDLLSVLAGSTSLALNRLAIGQATRDASPLGAMVIARGRRAVSTRAKALLDAAQRAGHLRFGDVQDAFETLYGLIVRDAHVRMLLGEKVDFCASRDAMRVHVERAVDQFYRLHGAGTQR